MNKKLKIFLFALLAVVAVLGTTWFLHDRSLALLNPRGIIALKERNLMVLATILMLLVVVPVLVMTFFIAWKYRAENTKAKYAPEWDHNLIAESIWWAIPSIIILALSIFAWNSSHDLDPFKPIASSTPSMTIQVIALDWKWLFIYPEQHIATVNYIRIPQNTPVHFEITSDAPMNSFWIPQLGGQIYAMPGMITQLNLIADQPGSYRGVSANLSGAGFAGMDFTAEATPQSDFNTWVQTVQRSSTSLNPGVYAKLAEPSSNNSVSYYAAKDSHLYDDNVMKFMMPGVEVQ